MHNYDDHDDHDDPQRRHETRRHRRRSQDRFVGARRSPDRDIEKPRRSSNAPTTEPSTSGTKSNQSQAPSTPNKLTIQSGNSKPFTILLGNNASVSITPPSARSLQPARDLTPPRHCESWLNGVASVHGGRPASTIVESPPGSEGEKSDSTIVQTRGSRDDYKVSKGKDHREPRAPQTLRPSTDDRVHAGSRYATQVQADDNRISSSDSDPRYTEHRTPEASRDRIKQEYREPRTRTSGKDASDQAAERPRRNTEHTHHRQSGRRADHFEGSPPRSEDVRPRRKHSSKAENTGLSYRSVSKEPNYESSRHRDSRRHPEMTERVEPEHGSARGGSSGRERYVGNAFQGQHTSVGSRYNTAGHSTMSHRVNGEEKPPLTPDDSVSAVDQRSNGWPSQVPPCWPGTRPLQYRGAWFSVAVTVSPEQFYSERMAMEREYYESLTGKSEGWPR